MGISEKPAEEKTKNNSENPFKNPEKVSKKDLEEVGRARAVLKEAVSMLDGADTEICSRLNALTVLRAYCEENGLKTTASRIVKTFHFMGVRKDAGQWRITDPYGRKRELTQEYEGLSSLQKALGRSCERILDGYVAEGGVVPEQKEEKTPGKRQDIGLER